MTAPSRPPTLDSLLAHRAWVRDLARRLAADDAAADDLEQDAWTAALRAAPSDGPGIRGWFGRVLRNRSREVHRGAARRGAREEAAARPESVTGGAALVAEAEAHARVVQAVLALPEPYREAVLLRFFQGLPPRGVAARTGVPVETVRTRMRRAVELLRGALGGRREDWIGAVAPLLAVRAGDVSGTVAAAGGVVMKLSTKAAIAAAALVLGMLAWTTWDAVTPGRPAASVDGGEVAVAAPAPGGPGGTLPRDRSRTPRAQPPLAGATDPPRDAPAPAPSTPATAARGAIVGRVVLADGRPAAGAAVRAPAPHGKAWIEVDADGRFEIPIAAAGDRVPVWVLLPGWRSPGVVPVAVSEDGVASVPEIGLERVGAVRLRGSVRTRGGRGIGGARVTVWMGAGSGETETGRQSGNPTLSMMLIAGDVWGASGLPPAVAAFRDLGAVTRDDGAFEFDVPADLGAIDLWASAPGHAGGRTQDRAAVEDLAAAAIDLVLDPLPRMRGRVVDGTTGLPLAGVRVGFGRWNDPAWAASAPVTDAEGRFDALATDPNAATFRVEAEGWVSATAAPSGDDCVVRLFRERAIEGRVVLSDGRGVEGAYLKLRHVRGAVAPTPAAGARQDPFTRADGTFRIAGLAEGSVFRLSVGCADRSKDSFTDADAGEVAAGTAGLRVVVEPALTVRGVVVDEEGRPLAGMYVAIGEGPGCAGDSTDEAGAFTLRGVPPGEHVLRALDAYGKGGGRLPARVPGVVAGASTLLRVTMERGRTITGRIVDPQGRSVAGRSVTAVGVEADPLDGHLSGPRARTDAEGRFEVGGLEQRAYALRLAWSDGGEPLWLVGGDRVEAGAPDVRLVMVPGGVISGSLLDAAGAPLARESVWIVARQDGATGRSAVTDDRGRFDVRGLPPGRTYTVVSVHGRVHGIAPGTRDLVLAPPR